MIICTTAQTQPQKILFFYSLMYVKGLALFTQNFTRNISVHPALKNSPSSLILIDKLLIGDLKSIPFNQL